MTKTMRTQGRSKAEIEVARKAGREIQRRREAAGLTRPELAVAAGIDPSALYRIEGGAKPRRLTRESLERALAAAERKAKP